MKANDIGRRKLTSLSLGFLAAAVSLLVALSFAPTAHAATASWSLSPPSYDFGAVAMGARSTPATFTLTNTGEADLPNPRVDLEFERPEDREHQESEIFEDGAFDCVVRADLGPGESCTVTLTFQPANRGSRSGTIRFVDPSSQVMPVRATFSGLGIGPIVSFSPPSIALGSWLLNEGPSLPKVLTISNSGDTDLSVSAFTLVDLGSNPDQIAVVGGTCHPGGTVAPGATCTIQLAFSPTVAGIVVGHLKVTDNAAQGYQLVRVEAIGATPPPPPLRAKLGRRPPHRTPRRSATFSFALASNPSAHFICRLDRRDYRPCTSPITYRRLPVGKHVFHVLPADYVPLTPREPATYRFEVVR